MLKHHPIRRALTGGAMIAAVSVSASARAATVHGPPVYQGVCQQHGHMYADPTLTGYSHPSGSGRNSGSGADAPRSVAPSLASVLRPLTPRERRYVVGIASLSPVQLWAAFGTSPAPPVDETRTR